MGIIYYDICAIPLFFIILFVCYSRKMTKGTANQLFITVVMLSLISAVADLGMELIDNMAPLNDTLRILCNVATYVYLVVRNCTNVVLLLFLLALTRTTFILRKRWARIAYSFPYAVIILMLLQNPFTHTAFTVTAEKGYSRGPLMLVFYGIAMIYGVVGFAYCIYCRRYLPLSKWGTLISVYVLVHAAVVVQFFRPEILIEMYFTAIAEMLIMLTIMRPEERMDADVGMLSWASYQSDVSNIILSGEKVQIVAIRIPNSREIRNYLGDHEYNRYISGIGNGIRAIRWKHPRRIEVYFEVPGTVYLIAEADEVGAENVAERLRNEAGGHIRRYTEMGVRFEPQVCLIRCPDDLRSAKDIIALGHIFDRIGGDSETVFADKIVNSRNFAVEAHIEEILDRAIKHNGVVMYYQPIYDVVSGSFNSAEALARIVDPEYGLISPAIFIPAAETQGFIIPIGDAVLDQVFRFLSEHDPDTLGLSYVEINLSVAQCMESSLPDKVRALQQKYGIDPARVNFEITETTFRNVSGIVLENVNELIRMGYSFALDDYGIGFSSIQRVNRIPLKLVKIDKSMLDDVSSSNGLKIYGHTVRMMQSIGKKIVAEGAETDEAVKVLKELNCDYIQGFCFSRPLPREEFIRFMENQ